MADLELSSFDRYWPIRDMLKLHLKYTSEASRKKKAEAMGRHLKAVLGSSSEPSEPDEPESEESD